MKIFSFGLAGLIISLSWSCGDVLSPKKSIGGNYYLIESERENGQGIYYKTNDGDFIGRIPGQIVEYGMLDSFLIAKVKQQALGQTEYYIINTNRDSDYADAKDYLISIISEQKYKSEWKTKLKVRFNQVK